MRHLSLAALMVFAASSGPALPAPRRMKPRTARKGHSHPKSPEAERKVAAAAAKRERRRQRNLRLQHGIGPGDLGDPNEHWPLPGYRVRP